MGVKIRDLFGKLPGIFRPAGGKFNLRGVVPALDDIRRIFPEFVQPLVSENLPALAVHHQNAVQRGIHLRFQKSCFPKQFIFGAFELGDVQQRTQQTGFAADDHRFRRPQDGSDAPGLPTDFHFDIAQRTLLVEPGQVRGPLFRVRPDF